MPMRTTIPYPGESTTSFCSRLAAANSLRMDDFCRDMGLRTRDIIEGKEEAIDELARIARIDRSRLRKHTTIKVDDMLTFGEEVFPVYKDYFNRTNVRFCPRCLEVDAQNESVHPRIRRYARTVWGFRWYRTCMDHSCSIVDAGRPLNPRFAHDFCSNLKDMPSEVSAAALTSRFRLASPFERYVSERLFGLKRHGDFLDSLSLQTGADICELVGAVVRDGRDSNLKDLSDDDWQEVAQIGFSSLSEGEAGWKRVLGMLCDSTNMMKSDVGGTAIFGNLHRVLRWGRSGWDYDRIRMDMRNFAVEHLPLTNGASFFGEKVSTGRISMSQAEKEHGRDPRLVRKLMIATAATGAVMGGAANSTLDEMAAMAAADRLKDIVSGEGAARLLGAGRITATIIFEKGFLKPTIERNSQFGISRQYSKTEVSDFLKKLFPECPCGDIKGLYPFEYAAKKARAPQAEVLKLLSEQKLLRVGVDKAKNGIQSLLLDPGEIRSHTALPDTGCLTIKDLMKALGTSRHVIDALLGGGYVAVESGRNSVTRRKQSFVRPEELERFQKEFSSFDALMREYGVARPRLRALLKQHSIEPALPVEEIRASFYRRADVWWLSALG